MKKMKKAEKLKKSKRQQKVVNMNGMIIVYTHFQWLLLLVVPYFVISFGRAIVIVVESVWLPISHLTFSSSFP